MHYICMYVMYVCMYVCYVCMRVCICLLYIYIYEERTIKTVRMVPGPLRATVKTVEHSSNTRTEKNLIGWAS